MDVVDPDSAEARVEGSMAELAVLHAAVESILASRAARLEAELAVTAPSSGGLWPAVGRILVRTVYTALERLVVMYSKDQRISTNAILQWLRAPSEDLPFASNRIPKFTKELKPAKRRNWRLGNGVALQQELIESFEAADIEISAELAQQVAALKLLRNDCLHPRPPAPEEAIYLAKAGFPQSGLHLQLEHLPRILRVLVELSKLISHNSFIESLFGSETVDRGDLLSDLPIYAETLARILEKVDNS